MTTDEEKLAELRKRFDAIRARMDKPPMTDERWRSRISIARSAAFLAGAPMLASLEGAAERLEELEKVMETWH